LSRVGPECHVEIILKEDFRLRRRSVQSPAVTRSPDGEDGSEVPANRRDRVAELEAEVAKLREVNEILTRIVQFLAVTDLMSLRDEQN
jgi:hypothetical protein